MPWWAYGLSVAYTTFGFLTARRSYRWNRRQQRPVAAAAGIALLAALFWPLVLSYWETEWLGGQRDWRGDRE